MRRLQFGIYAKANDFLMLCGNLNGWGAIEFCDVSRVLHRVVESLKGQYFKDEWGTYYLIKFRATEETFEKFCETNEIDECRQWW